MKWHAVRGDPDLLGVAYNFVDDCCQHNLSMAPVRSQLWRRVRMSGIALPVVPRNDLAGFIDEPIYPSMGRNIRLHRSRNRVGAQTVSSPYMYRVLKDIDSAAQL